MKTNQWISLRGFELLIFIVFAVISVVVLIQAITVLAPVIIPRLTGDIPNNQKVMFDNTQGHYPIIAAAPAEIRPGDTFTVTLRGYERPQFQTSTPITLALANSDPLFVQQTSPISIVVTLEPNADVPLRPHDISIETVFNTNPPEELMISVTQTISATSTLSRDIDSITIQVDRTPIPLSVVGRAIISLAAFLISVFGAAIVSKRT
jgi:hypothetical protein